MSVRDRYLTQHCEPKVITDAESAWSRVLEKHSTGSFYRGTFKNALERDKESYVITWQAIQEGINNCVGCKPGHVTTYREPVCPPEPEKGDIMFISEAPPPTGGFWDETSENDALRRNLCSILLPQIGNSKLLLESFRTNHYILVQTIKWPFLGTGMSVIRHAAISHIRYEISFIQPRGIIALGAVAGKALRILYPDSDFARSYKSGKTLEDMRFERCHAGGYPIRMAYLPVDRMIRKVNEFRSDILRFVEELAV